MSIGKTKTARESASPGMPDTPETRWAANRFLVASDSVCPCGAVRSAHLPVKEKAASSNLVRGARHRPGEVAQLAEHATENRGVGSSILPLATPQENGRHHLAPVSNCPSVSG
jgi:hypothetical protein